MIKPLDILRLTAYPVQAMRLGKVIKGWRERQKLGIRAVALDIGISHGTLSRVERDENVDGKTLVKLLFWLTSTSATATVEELQLSAIKRAIKKKEQK